MIPREAVPGMLWGAVADCYRPRPDYTVWQWAERNVYIDGKAGATAQFYRSDLTPWTRRLQECFTDPTVEEVVVRKSSQTGFTEAALNVIRYMPKHAPGNVLYAINSASEARDVSKRRLRSTLLRAAGDLAPDDPDEATTFAIHLRNMVVKVAGSGAAGPFMQSVYRVIVLDELEEHDATDDTTTIDRARSRFATVANSKLFALSKPKNVEGVICQEFDTGTCEAYHVPCPHCGTFQELEWSRLKFGHCRDLVGGWDFERLEAEVFYECRECEGRILEEHKPAMVNAGRWVPAAEDEREKPATPGKVSMQISDLYSLFPKVTWPRLARLWIESEGEELKRRHFWTNHLGKGWEERSATIGERHLLRLRAGAIDAETKQPDGQRYGWVYRNQELVGEIPFEPALLSITADRQQDRIKYLVAAWNGEGEAWWIDYGELFEDHDLLRLRERDYPVAGGGEPARIGTGLYDCGFERDLVYRACIASNFWILPARGLENVSGARMISERREFFDGHEFLRYDFLDHVVKNEFYIGKIARRSEPRLWLPWELPPAFAAEFAAERKVREVTNRGFSRYVWKKRAHAQNDFGDCGKLQYVLWHVIGAGVREAWEAEQRRQARARAEEAEKVKAAKGGGA